MVNVTPILAPNPRAEYQQRLDRHQERARSLKRLSLRLSIARLVVAFVAIVGGVVLAGHTNLSHSWIVPVVLVFAVLVIFHKRIADEEKRTLRQMAFYEKGLNRIDGCWSGDGISGEAYLEADHPYALDLDLFGTGSLFELLCTARTGSGEHALSQWLQHPATVSEIHERHEAVLELRDRLDFRERLSLQDEDIASALHPEGLQTWGQEPAQQLAPLTRIAAWLLPALTLTTIVGWQFADWGIWPFFLCATVQFAFGRSLLAWEQRVNRAMRRPQRELRLFAALLAVIEKEPVAAPLLVRLKADLRTDDDDPSKQINRLCNLAVLLDSAANMVFSPFAAFLLWNIHVAIFIESWRNRCGQDLGKWLAGVGYFEALNALAGYSFEHPDDIFPEVTEMAESGPPSMSAIAINHPLLPPSRAVANDLELGAEHQVQIVSGSNMSGKSTLLRTLGINAVLAFAGAPVRARQFRLPVLAIGASIRTLDSLVDGTSRFYAEITRLKQISDSCSGDVPVLFLLDEIMHGTNSHDRRIGAEALVRYLVAQGAIGLVTTHDLALAALADSLAPTVVNVHFEDTLIEGEMVFDFQLREGTVTKSNALELMRAVGLPVKAE